MNDVVTQSMDDQPSEPVIDLTSSENANEGVNSADISPLERGNSCSPCIPHLSENETEGTEFILIFTYL